MLAQDVVIKLLYKDADGNLKPSDTPLIKGHSFTYTKEKKELHKDIPLHNVYSYGALYDRDNTKLCCNPTSNATYDFTIILDTNKLSDDEFSILRFLLEYFAIRDKHKMLYVSLTHSIISKILDKKFDKNQSEQIISSLFKSEIFNS